MNARYKRLRAGRIQPREFPYVRSSDKRAPPRAREDHRAQVVSRRRALEGIHEQVRHRRVQDVQPGGIVDGDMRDGAPVLMFFELRMNLRIRMVGHGNRVL